MRYQILLILILSLSNGPALSLGVISKFGTVEAYLLRGQTVREQIPNPLIQEVDSDLVSVFHRLFPSDGNFNDLENILNQIRCILYAQPDALVELSKRLSMTSDELNTLLQGVANSDQPGNALQNLLERIRVLTGDSSVETLSLHLSQVISSCPYRELRGVDYLQALELAVQPIVNQLEIAPGFRNLVMHQIMLMEAIGVKIHVDKYKKKVPTSNNEKQFNKFVRFLIDKTPKKLRLLHVSSSYLKASRNMYGSIDWVESATNYYRLQMLINIGAPDLIAPNQLDFLFERLVSSSSGPGRLQVGTPEEIIGHIERWSLKQLDTFFWFKKAVIFLSWQPAIDTNEFSILVRKWIEKGPPKIITDAENEWRLYQHIDTTFVFPQLERLFAKLFQKSSRVRHRGEVLSHIQVGEELTFACPHSGGDWSFEVLSIKENNPFLYWCNDGHGRSLIGFVDGRVIELNFDGYLTDDKDVYAWMEQIFLKATKLGLQPHRSEGGGHKHIDFGSFANNPLLFFRFVIDMQASPFLARILGRTHIDHEHFHYWWFSLSSEQINFVQNRLVHMEHLLSQNEGFELEQPDSVKQMARVLRAWFYGLLWHFEGKFKYKETSVNLEHIDNYGTVELRFPGPSRDAKMVKLINELLRAHINHLLRQIDNNETYEMTDFTQIPESLSATESIELFKQYLILLGLDFETFQYLIHPALLDEAEKENQKMVWLRQTRFLAAA